MLCLLPPPFATRARIDFEAETPRSLLPSSHHPPTHSYLGEMTQPGMEKKEKKEKKQMPYIQLGLAQTLATELLTLIFEAVVADEHADRKCDLRATQDLGGLPDDPAFDTCEQSFAGTSAVLYSSSPVCKDWHMCVCPSQTMDSYPALFVSPDSHKKWLATCSVAEPLLYSKLAFNLPRDHRAATQFLAIIFEKPVLAAKVKSLTLGDGVPAQALAPNSTSPMAVSFTCLAILTRCTDVEHLNLLNFSGVPNETFLEVLRRCKRLRMIRQLCSAEIAQQFKPSLADLLNLRALSESVEHVSLFGGSRYSMNMRQEILLNPQVSAFSASTAIIDNPDLHALGCSIRALEFGDTALSDQQFLTIMGHLARTLSKLSISQDHRPGPYDTRISTAALRDGLAQLSKLEHLYISVTRDWRSAEPLLLAPLRQLQTACIPCNIFEFEGLGHLASTKLRHLHISTKTRNALTNIDEDQLVTSVKSMLQKPSSCPRRLSISHIFDRVAATDDLDAFRILSAEVAAELVELCGASGVAFTYSWHIG